MSISVDEPVAERLRGGRRRGHRDVVRHGGPQRDRRDVGGAARVVEHADDAGRALVARRLHAESLDQARVGRARGHGRRARVRDVGEQRAERDDELDAQLAREPGDQGAERAPAQARLAAEQQQRVLRGVSSLRVVERVLRPVDPPHRPVDERDLRPRRAQKSKKRSGSMSANRSALHVLRGNEPAIEAPWPPSFQPRNDAISTGRRSSGIASRRSSLSGSFIESSYCRGKAEAPAKAPSWRRPARKARWSRWPAGPRWRPRG